MKKLPHLFEHNRAWAARITEQDPEFFQRLKQIGFDGVVSLHSEYKGGHSFRRLKTTELLQQSAADLQYLKRAIS